MSRASGVGDAAHSELSPRTPLWVYLRSPVARLSLYTEAELRVVCLTPPCSPPHPCPDHGGIMSDAAFLPDDRGSTAFGSADTVLPAHSRASPPQHCIGVSAGLRGASQTCGCRTTSACRGRAVTTTTSARHFQIRIMELHTSTHAVISARLFLRRCAEMLCAFPRRRATALPSSSRSPNSYFSRCRRARKCGG